MLKKNFSLAFFFCFTICFVWSAYAQNHIIIDIGKKKIEFVKPKNKGELDIESNKTQIEIINLDFDKPIAVQLMRRDGGPINLLNQWLKNEEHKIENKIVFIIKEGGFIEYENEEKKLELPFDLKVIIDNVELKEITEQGKDIGLLSQEGKVETVQGETGKKFLLKKKKNIVSNPYTKNKVYLFFDENGKQIRRIPKNVDQDDVFIITIVTRKEEKHKYDIKIEEGEYAPSDLSIRPLGELKDDIATASADEPKDPWDLLEFERGPFTTERFRFTITYYDDEKKELVNLKTYSVRINKFYHAGFGISFLKTRLEDPSFDIAPLTDTTNTIIKLDKGDRSIVTVNAIWYWRIFHKDFWTGSGLTKGRDVLKESPFYDRIFPTFGVSFDSNFKENFFFGFVYEFARGANLTVGLHYGKVKRLADEDFEIGKDVYVGTKDDILITNKWESGLFIGLTIDTRIFNAIFGLRK